MIPIAKQVTSLEPSKRLKELEVKQDSLFAWYQGCGGIYCEYRVHQASRDAQSTHHDGYVKLAGEICAAFTVAELGEMLPARLKTDYGSWTYLHITKLENSKEWVIDYNYLLDIAEIRERVEADARAKMLIWLIENKMVGAKKEDV